VNAPSGFASAAIALEQDGAHGALKAAFKLIAALSAWLSV